METSIINRQDGSIATPEAISIENRLEIIDEGIRKKYLARLSEMTIAPTGNLPVLEDDFISNVRLYRITEMVYQKGEPVTDKFTTVFNTLSTYNASVFVLIDSDGKETRFYLGVRNNEPDESPLKRSTVTLGDTLKQTLTGHFPGAKIVNEDRKAIAEISKKISETGNVASVSVVGNSKSEKDLSNEQFVQGLEKLVLAMSGRPYIGLIIADNQSPQNIQIMRKNYQDLYTKLSPFQKLQISDNISTATSKSQSFTEMNGKQKAAMIGSTLLSLAGVAGGIAGTASVLSGNINNGANAIINNAANNIASNIGGMASGAMIGGQITGQLGGFINSLAPTEQITKTTAQTTSSTLENKAITDMLLLLDDLLKKTNEYDSYGLWNVAGYFISDDMSAAEIAASNYRSLMNGEKSGREISAINSWRRNDGNIQGNFSDLTTYLSRFVHPKFVYGGNIFVNAATAVSGKELGLHLGLPRATVPGLPVIEHAEFGKEVISYQLIQKNKSTRPEDRITIGKIFDLGQITNKEVELNNKSLNMHTFITGSTGSGKSNTVYQMLTELYQDKIPFLVVEPAKGEYKDVFGNWSDVNVYSTNPKIAQLIHLNPFMFPESIHVLEHVDGLIEIFGVCWPMYDAMPAFFKDAILKSYEKVGWDLGSSTYEGNEIEYPDFEILAEELERLIDNTEYSAEVKGNYTGALVTRVKSLTVGLNKFIFTTDQTPYERLFDENCILDISRVKSSETKALLMGLIVYILNEYRMDTKQGNNSGLKHITVLEEAHNLLKNTSNSESELVGKSVEMLTNTIAEIRTYGEGFVIVDQSPSSVDIAAIKNTNTKIVLRTPEANDREAIGRSMGLTPNQVNEIAKLPSGVAVIYQNDWVSPVLTMVDKANIKEVEFVCENPIVIKSTRESRTEIIKAIMEPWMPGKMIEFSELAQALNSLEVTRSNWKLLSVMLCTYRNHNGHMIWNEASLGILRQLLFDILDISQKLYGEAVLSGNPDSLRKIVISKTKEFTIDQVNEICNILTMEV